MIQDSQRPVLLTGVNGQVGFELARSLQGLGKIVALDRTRLDLANPDQIRAVVRDLKPRIIVNPAAYTAVDAAESDAALAMRLNAEAPAVFAQEAKRIGAALVQYSTDYVFDGTKAGAWAEGDEAKPLSIYGKSKLAAEQAIADSGCHHLIFRTSWVYGLRGRNFLLTMLRLAVERDRLRIVSDQIGAPTWAVTIAALTAQVLAQAAAVGEQGWSEWWTRHTGVYHLTAAGETSWYGFAEAIFEMGGLVTRPEVEPIPSLAYPTPAARPANSRLSNARFAQTFGLCAPHWRDALELCLAGR
ncbi:dTDP-4-dehydrorhamnose reductase [Paraburkholderia caballeronis]|uniref:dTDP-4-dehydrorhamnose reductase n=1 Tax=Paraburkholderia caballeronis TaxID=416943 RepID=UPI001064D104|nr:dTDP-4-dehydrorhamnose reductase [Paraburkholderia caballeronis]TDV34733.1 dTDP-4-dehydrorhamnose reductase [Paraburkholderia caballeronis]